MGEILQDDSSSFSALALFFVALHLCEQNNLILWNRPFFLSIVHGMWAFFDKSRAAEVVRNQSFILELARIRQVGENTGGSGRCGRHPSRGDPRGLGLLLAALALHLHFGFDRPHVGLAVLVHADTALHRLGWLLLCHG